MARMDKKIFPSTFRSVMLLNWLMAVEFASFRMRTVNALCHSEGMT